MTELRRLPPEPSTEPAIAIADALREEILQVDAGHLLGGEYDLIARFGVSRPTFQQAMRILQSEGLLRVRRGVNGGLFAKPPTPTTVARSMSLLLRHNKATHTQVSQVLFALAGEVVRLAATNPDEVARRLLMAEIVDFDPPEDLDERTRILLSALQFGQLMSQLSANQAVTLLVEVFLALIPEQLATTTAVEGNFEASRDFQRAVANAVAEGDEARAQSLIASMRDAVQGWFT